MLIICHVMITLVIHTGACERAEIEENSVECDTDVLLAFWRLVAPKANS